LQTHQDVSSAHQCCFSDRYKQITERLRCSDSSTAICTASFAAHFPKHPHRPQKRSSILMPLPA
jgi:hypothetical protein